MGNSFSLRSKGSFSAERRALKRIFQRIQKELTGMTFFVDKENGRFL